jgi:hypothetical protein
MRTIVKGKELKLTSDVLEKRVFDLSRSAPTKKRAKTAKSSRPEMMGISDYTNPGDRLGLKQQSFVDKNVMFC